MSNLNAAKKKAWDLVLSNLPFNSYIFGGAARDYIAGDVYNDIDIYFANQVGRIKFQQALEAAGLSLVRQTYKNEYGTPDLERYHLTVDGETIQLDLVTKGSGSQSNPVGFGLDLDVNGLGLISHGDNWPIEFFLITRPFDSPSEIMEKIKKRQFMIVGERSAKVEALKAR